MASRLMEDLLAHLEKVSDTFRLKEGKVVACMAGGTAVNFYTEARMSDDTDIAWSHRVIISADKQHFETIDEDGLPTMVVIDAHFSESIGLFHPDWKEDATVVAELPNLIVKVISPVDLVVSKIGRFAERDRDDIRLLARHVGIDPEAVRTRANEAIDFYIGDTDYIRVSLDLALEILNDCRNDESRCKP